MKSNVLFILFFAFVFDASSQNSSEETLEKDTLLVSYKNENQDSAKITDTFFFESEMHRHYLVGSQILPGTKKKLTLWGYDLALVDVTIESCNKNVPNVGYERANYFRDSIVYYTQTDSSLKVHVAVSGNCCHSFLFDAEVDTSGILNLIYIGYGSYCACNCGVCFSYEFIFPGYGFEKEEYIQDIKGIMLNGDRKTLLMVEEK